MALYKTKETALKHLRNGQSFSNKAFDLFRDDREVNFVAMQHDSLFKCIPSAFKNDKELAGTLLLNMKSGGLSHLDMQSIGFELLNDKTFISRMMGIVRPQVSASLYIASGNDVRIDYEICLKVVKHQSFSITFIPDKFRNDTEILIAFAEKLPSQYFREGWLKRLIEELGLPDLEKNEIVDFIKARELKNALESNLSTKEDNKRKVKI